MTERTKKRIQFQLNGEERTFEIDPNEKLIDLLRRSGYLGVKNGCAEGMCGSCTVIMNNKAVLACLLYAFQVNGQEIWTIEGVGDEENPHPIQQALIDEGAVQCGYCIPGIILSAKAMFDKDSSPDDETMKQYMDGNLCRCTGYDAIYSALKKVAKDGGVK